MKKELIVNLFSDSSFDINWHFIDYFKDLNKAAYLSLLLKQYKYEQQHDNLIDDLFILTNKEAGEILYISNIRIGKIRTELIQDDLVDLYRAKTVPPKQYIGLNFKKIGKILAGRF